ncbi:GTP cyclohydrolase 1 [Mycobacterium basiliense]|uniref:GTP cyclohydrolase 1 n=1 Tax=Mycobacterium basiliense TaxID=2094119 RepID=A0A3S4DWV1_9MYCO|nr:GTP cyclohydrolase I [Mycobacterium basiliense]VDM91167.1 GTP cyclohydrolase 1 [Mycobacterium basiliense]
MHHIRALHGTGYPRADASQPPSSITTGAATRALGDAELVVVRPVPFRSLCADHLLPFQGVVHIGHIDSENHLSTPELTRIVAACTRSIQTQQPMTIRIGLWLHHQLVPRGVGVLVKANYACAAAARGDAHLGRPATTMAFCGSMRHSADERQEFVALARRERHKGAAGQ